MVDPSPQRRSGIYAITHVESGKRYIGSTDSFLRRWCEHRGDLARNEHHSQYLQNAYNKYGVEAFTYEILEFVEDLDLLHAREEWWFAKRLLERGSWEYNVKHEATGTRGVIFPPEVRKRIADKLRGRKASLELRAKLSAAHKGKPLNERQRAAYERRRGLPGRPLTPDEIARFIERNHARKGKPISDAQRNGYLRRYANGLTERRIAAYQRMRERPPTAAEQAAKDRLREQRRLRFREMGLARRNTLASEEHRTAISNGLKRSYATDPGAKERRAEGIRRAHARRSPEAKAAIYAKIGAKSRGRVMSPEARARMSESAKRRHARERAARAQQQPPHQLPLFE